MNTRSNKTTPKCAIIRLLKNNPGHGLPAYRVYVLQGDTALNTSDFTTKDIQRFWSKVNIPDDPDACWEWQASTNYKGYGQFGLQKKMLKAHRIVWCLTNGGIPTGLQVCHRCDNRACCNPNHLFLGTNLDNVRDMVDKGRTQRGEHHHKAKLTPEKIREIRKIHTNGNATCNQLAKHYGVTPATIYKILKNERWKHIV